MSCCGHGGSWFGKCGSTIDAKFDHTWYEGLQECKSRPEFQTAIEQHLNETEQQKHERSDGAGDTNPKDFIITTKQLAFASAPVLDELSIIAPVHTSANASMAYATSTELGKLSSNAAAAIAIASTSANMTSFMSSVVSDTVSGRVIINHNPAKISVTTPANARVDYQGSKQVLDISGYACLSVNFVFFITNLLI